MAKNSKTSRLAKALLQTAGDMRKAGLLDKATHDKITMRHLGAKGAPKVARVTAEQIRTMRERAKMSQAVFARYLNLTVGYVSQLERGTKQPTGAALALLNVIRRKGIDAIL
jgi:putative transcriptional regulator